MKPPISDALLGILFMVFSMAFFAGEDASIKYLAQNLPLGQVVFLVGALGGGSLALITKLKTGSLQLHQCRHPIVLFRMGAEMFGTLFFVLALSLIPLMKLSVLIQIMPLLIAMGAALFLKEKVGPRRWSAIFIGLFGVMIIIRPAGMSFQWGDIFALLAMVGLAARDLSTRRVPADISTLALSAVGFSMITLSGLILIALDGWAWLPMTWGQWGGVMLATTMGILGYFTITTSTRITEASLVVPYRYARVVFGSFLGIVMFNERPDMWMIVGALIIVFSGLYLLWRERVVQQ